MTIRRDGYVVITHAFEMYGRSSGYLGKPHGSSPNYHHRFYNVYKSENMTAFRYLL
nr:MAG TPA: hypothetical protein [Caudoviricetes sp.]